jgi:hypothetical protein
MKSTDKFLIGIVAGIVILIVVALVVTLTQPEATYQSAETPEGVVHNYLLALQKGDYELAWGYLSPTIRGYPRSINVFTRDIQSRSWNFRLNRESSMSIEAVNITGNRANVTVKEVWLQSGDLFDSGQSSRVFQMNLLKARGEWKIVESDAYWAPCWNQSGGCN